MRKEKNNIFLDLDWFLIFIYLILIFFGWINIYAASSTDNTFTILDLSTKYGKQIIWIILCLPLIIFILFFNSKFYEQFSSLLYLISIASLIGVFLFGKKINGATSWYSLGSFNFQPSEFSKVITALALAKLMSDRKYNLKLVKNQIKAIFIIFLPAILISFQPDMGSALVYFSFFFVLNREGLTSLYIILGILAILFFLLTIYFGVKLVLFISLFGIIIFTIYGIYKKKGFLKFNAHRLILVSILISTYIIFSSYIFNNIFKQHHRDRFNIILRKKIDKKGVGYNSYQSELTISSGGLFGKGFLKGDRTHGNFVPEQDTDYIFSTIAEEWGFVGSSIVIIVFILLIFRILFLSEKTPNKFGKIYGYGVASIFFTHIFINIGMVIGLLPTVGIPLPFFSYGGSSLWAFTILLFIFIRLDAHKNNDW